MNISRARIGIALCLAVAAVGPGAAVAGERVLRSHGLAMHGSLKYPADFSRFDYVDLHSSSKGIRPPRSG
jgi:microcin C transport system substrate-binding protein